MFNSTNSVANVMKGIGVGTFAVSVLAGLVMSSEMWEGGGIVFLVWAITGFISGSLFFAFGEVIDLLTKIMYREEKILACIEYTSTGQKTAPMSTLNDIENNLPEI